MRRIDARHAKRLVHADREIAFLDVREAGQFGEGHPLFAVPCPYSELETRAIDLVPRKSACTVLIDAGDGIAEIAAGRLEGIGYSDIRVVDGGTPGWAAAGYTLFKGVNVPSKTLGELVETTAHVPTVDAATLAEWHREKAAFRLFDARPAAEYAKMRVPGGVCLPNGELAHRFEAAIDDPNMPVIVNCAGRTRSITGVAGLRLLGVPNPVYALENGTQGWALAGEALERGNEAQPFLPLSEAQRAASRERGRALSERQRISWIGPEQLEVLAADEDRALFVLDVRSAEEYAAGTTSRAVHAPGGQLVQATDQWVGVRHARLILVDDTGLRGSLAAFWLRQLGFEPYVLPDIDQSEVRSHADTALGRENAAARLPDLPQIGAREAQDRVNMTGAAIIDLRGSMAHNAARIPGSKWSIRPRLSKDVESRRRPVLLLADDEKLAALAAVDLREMGHADIALIADGLSGWRAAGLPVETEGAPVADDDAIDFLFFVHDRHDGNADASREYLAWETGLIDQLDHEERGEFTLAL